MTPLPEEKRRCPRVNQELPVQIIANGYDFVTSTQNISCIGAYCHIDKYVPPFTRIMVKLTLPVNAARTKQTNIDVICKGVIVRTEDEENGGGFNIAVFFNDIKEAQKQRISSYVSQFLP